MENNIISEEDTKSSISVIPVENLMEIDNFKSEFTCSICLGLVIKPQLLKCCDHLICSECLKKYIRSTTITPRCPLCKHSLNYSEPNKIIFRLYCNLRLICMNSNKGCREIIKAENYFQHVYNECPFRETNDYKYCKKCSELYMAEKESEHFNKCCENMKEMKESKLHEHCLKYTNLRKHINYEKFGWLCDYCEAGKNPMEKSYHCRKCGVDICDDCINYVKNKSSVTKVHVHELTLTRVVDWVCNVCSKEGDYCFAWSCAACDFDACLRCYWN